jgi:transposase
VKKLNTETNYVTNKRNVQLKIDEIFAKNIIPANDSVRLLDEVMEGIDYSPLMRAYKRNGRRPATNPVTMMKVLVYAAMQGIFSSRAIALACTRDINFIWLLNGEKAPNHSEIARFRSKRLTGCSEELFYQLVEKLALMGEINYEHLFVDGTKIEANANKCSFVWKKSITKYELCLHEKPAKLTPELCSKYSILAETAEDLLRELEARITTQFVYGRGKRKSEEQKDIELLQKMLERKGKYAKYQEIFKGRNSFSKTVSDATFMRSKNLLLKQIKNRIVFHTKAGFLTGWRFLCTVFQQSCFFLE